MRHHEAILEKPWHGEEKRTKFPLQQRKPPQPEGTDLRTDLEVILLIIPVDVPLLACARAPASWDGEAGGPL